MIDLQVAREHGRLPLVGDVADAERPGHDVGDVDRHFCCYKELVALGEDEGAAGARGVHIAARLRVGIAAHAGAHGDVDPARGLWRRHLRVANAVVVVGARCAQRQECRCYRQRTP